jgi:hypothetical protein
MIDSPYFKIVSSPKKRSKLDPNEILSGDYWGVKLIDGQYILDFISGSHGGDLKKIILSENEFNLLKSGEIAVESILTTHRTG